MEKDKVDNILKGPVYAGSSSNGQSTEAFIRILNHWHHGSYNNLGETTQRTRNAFYKFLESKQNEQLQAEAKRVRIEELTKQLQSVKKYHDFLAEYSQQAADEFAKFYISSILEEYVQATVEETLDSSMAKIVDLVTKALLK